MPLGGHVLRQLYRKRVGLGGVAKLWRYGPEAAKATGRPMCKGSCKEKGGFKRGYQIRGILPWGRKGH